MEMASEPQDGVIAAQRGFACAPINASQVVSPPHVVRVEVKRLQLDIGRGEIWAMALDDKEVKKVWAMVYEPSYQPPTSDDEMISEPVLRTPLNIQGGDFYASSYNGFVEKGVYRVVVYVEDDEGLTSQPAELKVAVGGIPIYPASLPLDIEIPIGAYTTTLAIPAGALTETIVVNYRAFMTVTQMPTASMFAGRSFEVDAYQRGVLQAGLKFVKPVTMTVRYSDTDMEGLDEESLRLAYYNGTDWATDGLTTTARLTATNELIVHAAHLTRFALFGEPLAPVHSIYLPLVMRR